MSQEGKEITGERREACTRQLLSWTVNLVPMARAQFSASKRA